MALVGPPSPEAQYELYRDELALLTSAWRSGQPTSDPDNGIFFGMPPDDFLERLRKLRDEVESRAYLAIVAAAEAVIQLDLRARARARTGVPLRDWAREVTRSKTRGRLVVETILGAWKNEAAVRKARISEFKQLFAHRHWLAHGRYFRSLAGVPPDPAFAIQRTRALFSELERIDPEFPRG